MKLHPIFSKEFAIWWGGMIIGSIIKFSIFGLPKESGLEKYGIIFWTLGALLTGLVFGSILYLLYRWISGKWNNKTYIIIITVAWFIFLVIQ